MGKNEVWLSSIPRMYVRTGIAVPPSELCANQHQSFQDTGATTPARVAEAVGVTVAIRQTQ